MANKYDKKKASRTAKAPKAPKAPKAKKTPKAPKARNNIFSKATLKKTKEKRHEKNGKVERKEIRRIFSKANKRIARIREKGLASTALNAILKQGIEKFSLKNAETQMIKSLYNLALSFLKNPTSTISGIKEYQNYFSEKYNVDKSLINDIIDLQQNNDIYDFVYTLSLQDFYAFIQGYYTLDEVLEYQGFEGDIKDYQVEIDKDTHQMLLKRIAPASFENMVY